jgi:AraC-like DNA-binding protein
MEYCESTPPVALSGLIKANWTLKLNGKHESGLDREASPDGCIELIHRYHGDSNWRRPQPALFVGGLIEHAAQLRMSGDACFAAVRLWPWTWNALFAPHSSLFVDDWVGMPDTIGPDFAARGPAAISRLVEDRLCRTEIAEIGAMIIASSSVGELARYSGKPMRWLQRWFRRHVGIPPQRYFRMLRFQTVMDNFQRDELNLAHHAAEHGFADQAHMARDFRAFVGTSAQKTRRSAKGPFFERNAAE